MTSAATIPDLGNVVPSQRRVCPAAATNSARHAKPQIYKKHLCQSSSAVRRVSIRWLSRKHCKLKRAAAHIVVPVTPLRVWLPLTLCALIGLVCPCKLCLLACPPAHVPGMGIFANVGNQTVLSLSRGFWRSQV